MGRPDEQLSKRVDAYARRRWLTLTLYAGGCLLIGAGLLGFPFFPEHPGAGPPFAQAKHGDPLFWWLRIHQSGQQVHAVLIWVFGLLLAGVALLLTGRRIRPHPWERDLE